MNLSTKITNEEIQRVMGMEVRILLRNSIKLLKTYPSVNRDQIRSDLILDYKDGAKLTNKEEIDKAIDTGRKGLIHIMAYNKIRHELLFGKNYNIHVDATTPVPKNRDTTKAHKEDMEKLEKTLKNSKKPDDQFEYFT
jgi:hypothetical protein